MAYIKATLRDIIMPMFNMLRPGGYSADPVSPNPQPMDCMVNDPVLDLAGAEEAFQASQVRAGREAHDSGMIDSAADEANLRAYRESLGGPFAGPFPEPVGPPEPQFQGPPEPPEPEPLVFGPDPLLKPPGGF